ncbi:MAG: nucleotidyl transferase AbiEii/AbiGii toxin family protein [Clostridia bacterium]
MFVAEDDSGTVNFEYPSAFQDRSILKVIRLEIGALAAWNPTQKSLVTSYAAQQYPAIFKQTDTEILTTTASRSFWEKATILHQEAFRPEGSKLPDRYSRHYYDLYCIAKSTIITDALAQPELLEKVAEFKQKFYPSNWARYDLARVGTIRLVPAKHSITALRADYAKMRAMIYGDYPSFEELMDGIRKLEQEINGYD